VSEAQIIIPSTRIHTFSEIRRRVPIRGALGQDFRDEVQGKSVQEQINEFISTQPVVVIGSKIHYGTRYYRREMVVVLVATVRYVNARDLVQAQFGS
jgi:hypothetical protein